jgi:hypothetical protein
MKAKKTLVIEFFQEPKKNRILEERQFLHGKEKSV